jgi:hypothetical protein
MRTGKLKGGILIWGMVWMSAGNSVIDAIYYSMDDLEKSIFKKIKPLSGDNTFSLISKSRRNILIVRLEDNSGSYIVKFTWGIMHEDIGELFKVAGSELDKIRESGVIEHYRLMASCLTRHIVSSIRFMASNRFGVWDWNPAIAGLGFILRKLLDRLDFTLDKFNDMIETFNVRLGRHVKCYNNCIEYENGQIVYKLFVDESHPPHGEIMFRRDNKTTIGVGFKEEVFYWSWWYQIQGKEDVMRDYIGSMFANGDI